MRKTIAVVISLFMIPGLGLAQEFGPAPKKCDQSQELHMGEVSPCWGILMPQPWVLKGIECLQVDLPHCDKRNALEIEGLKAEIEALKQKLQISETAFEEQSVLLDQALDIYEPPPWYKSPWLWGTTGLILGASAASYLAVQLRD